MFSRLTRWISPGVRRALLLLFKLSWGLLVLVLLAAIAGVVLLAETDAPPPHEGPRLIEKEGRWQTAHAGLARQSWATKKPPAAFRVFLFGGSQAFGSPYVHRNQLATFRLLEWLEVPNRGGIATWLEAYLQHLMPDREVQVVNLAMPGAPISEVRMILPPVLAHGSPDLLLILAGNNEGSIWEPEKFLYGEAFDTYLQQVEDAYSESLDVLVEQAGAAEVPIWLLTVPTNLRDHLPSDRGGVFEIPPALEAANAGDCESVKRLTAGVDTDHAVAIYLQARCLDASGRTADAAPLYERARARDKIFQRVRPGVNDLLRSRAGGELVRVVDLDAAMHRAARDGIPGDDLFLDSCHMRLSGYRLMALELARSYGEEQELDPERIASLTTLPVEVLSPEQLSRLYAVKRIKWLRLRLLSAADSVDWINRDRFASNFEAVETDFGDLTFAVELLEQDLPALQADPATGSTDPE